MPDRVSSRIAVAFVVVGLVAALAVGAGLFVGLRTLHQEATISALGDVAQPVLARVRAVAAAAELRPALTAINADLRPEIELYAIAGRRVVAAEDGGATTEVGSIEIGPAVKVGEAVGGQLLTGDGSRLLYSATVVRREGLVAGPIAIVLTVPDASGAMALRDLLRVLPAVAIVTALIAIPIAWLLSRSITRPLRRLAEATSVVPAAGATPTPPLTPGGPREIRDLTHRFNAMAAELDRTRAEERELLANVRHDLRTPLTVVAGFAEALRDGTATAAGSDGAARAGEAIAQEAQRMGRLVDDLRSIDELGTGGVALRPEALDPGALVADAVARFAPRAAAAGVALRADADPGLALAADRAAVERILGNLVDNAVAVSRHGGQVLVEARLAAGGAVALRISDDGPGFPAGSLERAFDRFYRADPARTGPGTGLGLSIVRALARAHGGDAVAENLAPTGARVTVTFPAVPVARIAATPAADDHPPSTSWR
ncbi:MAG TPA: HAMP domain-containing sensor histidine kinase [Candidatus Limnocylindrales bacterium]|nr:HAMP domain-containing sensor histidine kinase [Candidatus Limnocylindrales bacterium]